MAANAFDQFDAADSASDTGGNAFDQFDTSVPQPGFFQRYLGNNPGPTPETNNTWGQAVKNVGQAGAHLLTGIGGAIAGGAAGLGALELEFLKKQWNAGDVGAPKPAPSIDPAQVQASVANATTYTPANQDTLSMKVAQTPAKVLGWAGEQLAKPVKGIPYAETFAENLPTVGMNALGLKGVRALGAPPKPAVAPVPSTAALGAAKTAAYKAAEDAGVVIAPQSMQAVVSMIDDVANKQSLGKLPPELKETRGILTERIEANKPLTLAEADQVRQLINDAKASTSAKERRLAKTVQTKFDEYLNNLKPEDTLAGDAATAVSALKDARELHGRYKNSELVDKMERRANNVGEANYSQAGSELALRREFLRLANKDTTPRFFTPEQQAAISKVAAPGAWANTLRNIGKTDPMKGGIPAVSATIIGGGLGSALGPAGALSGGLIGPALLGGISHLANRGAQAITRSNVLKAREALVGRGLPSAKTAGAAAIPAKGAILNELRRLDVDLAALSKSEPFDSPKRRALQQRADLLRAQLVIGESSAASQR